MNVNSSWTYLGVYGSCSLGGAHIFLARFPESRIHARNPPPAPEYLAERGGGGTRTYYIGQNILTGKKSSCSNIKLGLYPNFALICPNIAEYRKDFAWIRYIGMGWGAQCPLLPPPRLIRLCSWRH